MSTLLQLAAAVVVLLPATGRAAVLEVGAGLTYPTIGAALLDADHGDTISVAPGVYDEHLTLDRFLDIVSTQGPGVTRLTNSGPEPEVAVITSGVRIEGFDVAPGSRAGFVLDGSAAATLDDVVVHDIVSTTWGAVRMNGTSNSDLIVLNSRFENNTSGATIDLFAADNITIIDSVFDGNSPLAGAALTVLYAESLTVRGCTFSNNVSSGSAGAIEAANVEHVDVFFSTFTDNRAPGAGGALSIINEGSEVAYNTFIGNAAPHGGAVSIRGGEDRAFHLVHHNLFLNNTAIWAGGAIHLSHGQGPPQPGPGPDATVAANTLVANRAPYGASIAVLAATQGAVVNNILAHHVGGVAVFAQHALGPADHNLWFANVGGDTRTGATGPGAVLADPLFVAFVDDGDPTNDDFSLQPGSPAIDAGRRAFRDEDGSLSDIGMTGAH